MNSSHTPPDWNDDRKLWDVLGRLRPSPPPSNFLYCIRQKLARTNQKSPWTILSWLAPRLDSIVSPGRRIWTLAGVAACLLLVAVILQFRMPQNRLVDYAKDSNGETVVEISQLAQNYELLQDFEVIEHLDEL